MAGQETEDSTDQGKHPKELEEQETEDSTDQGNPPTDEPHYKKWISFSLLCISAVMIALAGILIFNFYEIPASSHVQSGETVPMPKVLSDLEYCQQQLKQFYKDTTSTIPSHPLLPSRTVNIDDFFVNLELSREVTGNVMPGDRVKLSGEQTVLDKVPAVPLDSWEDLFKQDIVEESKIILSGGAGYGKTTILGKIANAWSVKGKLAKFKLVFLLKLRQMRKSSCIIDAIFDQILPTDTDLTKAKMKDIIANNQADIAFLLDGLDEIPSNVLKSKKGVYTIKDVLRNRVLIKCYVLVSTRPHMIHYVLSGYPHYARVKTFGFTTENKHKYIKSYFPDNITSAEALISRLRSQPSLHSLTENPMISQMVCIIWRNQESLPHNITALYAKFAETLVRRRFADSIRRQRLNGVMNDLGRVALNGLLDSKNKRLVFDRVEFSDCTTCLDDGCQFGFLQRENITSGLDIKEVATFHHLSLQEYFASRYLIHLLDNDENTFSQWLNRIGARDLGEMETFLRFCCGQSPKAAKIILKHIRKMNYTLEHAALSRLLLFESGSRKLVTEVDEHYFLLCFTLEDMLSLRFYLQALPNKPSRKTAISISCSSHEDITVARELLLDNIEFAEMVIKYTVSKDWNKESLRLEETLISIEEKLRARFVLAFYINERSVFDYNEIAESITRLSHIQFKFAIITLVKLPLHKVLKMVDALKDCRLFGLAIYDINMHGHLLDLAPLITSTLQHMTCLKCHLLDDDVESLESLLQKSEKNLESLNIGGNAFTSRKMALYKFHLNKYFPKLFLFIQGNSVLAGPF